MAWDVVKEKVLSLYKVCARAFWDNREKSNTIIIATHGIIKKTDKTPLADLDKAERLRKQYFNQSTHKK